MQETQGEEETFNQESLPACFLLVNDNMQIVKCCFTYMSV